MFTTNSLCLIICPIHEWRLFYKIFKSHLSSLALLKNFSFVILSVHFIFNILLQHHVSNAFMTLSSFEIITCNTNYWLQRSLQEERKSEKCNTPKHVEQEGLQDGTPIQLFLTYKLWKSNTSKVILYCMYGSLLQMTLVLLLPSPLSLLVPELTLTLSGAPNDSRICVWSSSSKFPFSENVLDHCSCNDVWERIIYILFFLLHHAGLIVMCVLTVLLWI